MSATFDGIRLKCCPTNNNQAGNDRRSAAHSGLITPVVIRVYSRRYVRFASIKRHWRQRRIFPNYCATFICRIASHDAIRCTELTDHFSALLHEISAILWEPRWNPCFLSLSPLPPPFSLIWTESVSDNKRNNESVYDNLSVRDKSSALNMIG